MLQQLIFENTNLRYIKIGRISNGYVLEIICHAGTTPIHPYAARLSVAMADGRFQTLFAE